MRMRSGFINRDTTFGHKSIVYDSMYFSLSLQISNTYKAL